jgi:hypothetical protein
MHNIVTITVSGPVGCGKSAIAGEIEIAMKAIGVPVQWRNSQSEKNMTHADWQSYIEMYQPMVTIVERIDRPHGIIWWRWRLFSQRVLRRLRSSISIIILALLLTGCADSRCPQGTGYTWKCDSAGNCGCHSNPGGG